MINSLCLSSDLLNSLYNIPTMRSLRKMLGVRLAPVSDRSVAVVSATESHEKVWSRLTLDSVSLALLALSCWLSWVWAQVCGGLSLMSSGNSVVSLCLPWFARVGCLIEQEMVQMQHRAVSGRSPG